MAYTGADIEHAVDVYLSSGRPQAYAGKPLSGLSCPVAKACVNRMAVSCATTIFYTTELVDDRREWTLVANTDRVRRFIAMIDRERSVAVRFKRARELWQQTKEQS